jgi:phospholipid/cholesterol/gamma-HCH transport system ATP-binding protein
MKPESDPQSASRLQDEVRSEIQRELAEHPARAGAAELTVELRNVSLSYGEHQVLRDLSFGVTRGQILCVLGGSGVGKSTILRLILGLMPPDNGQILVSGSDICTASLEEVLELREQMGMVFQGSALFDSLSVFDNVAFPLYEHTLSIVDLDPEEVWDLLPAELSGGMRKRVGIARAIIHEPPILLFDEPTSGLDPVTTRTIDELILKLRRELGVSAVIVTHNIRSAARVANRVGLLSEGEFLFMGTPEEMYASDDEYVRAFLG